MIGPMHRILPACAALLLILLGCAGVGGGGGAPFTVETLVPGANFPTQIRFAPDGRIFYTELTTGRIRIIENGVLLATAFATVPVATSGEQGLLGLAFDPDFGSNGFVYVYHTNPSPLKNRVIRFTAVGNLGTNLTVIVDNIPVNNSHNGGRVGFGADNKLYVTVGDSGDPANSQGDSSLAGKLLRYNADGSIPADNPIAGNPLFAKGLRNSFGLAFHPVSGRPYVSENGPTCDDELNRIVAGGNYGWRPLQPCGDTDGSFILPIRRFNPTIAPTGAAFYTGSAFPQFVGNLLVCFFNDGTLRRFEIDDAGGGLVLAEITLFTRASGLLDVAVGPDGFLYVAASDAIYRLSPP